MGFRFSNSHHMPHNFAIVEPGALEDELLKFTSRDTDWKFEELRGSVAEN